MVSPSKSEEPPYSTNWFPTSVAVCTPLAAGLLPEADGWSHSEVSGTETT